MREAENRAIITPVVLVRVFDLIRISIIIASYINASMHNMFRALRALRNCIAAQRSFDHHLNFMYSLQHIVLPQSHSHRGSYIRFGNFVQRNLIIMK